MVTVIATGFNKRGTGSGRPTKIAPKVIERIPSGIQEIQKFDEPTVMRKGGFDINPLIHRSFNEDNRERINKSDSDKPAFLRKIMD